MNNPRYIQVFCHIILVVWILAAGAIPVRAADPGPTDPTELEAFLDALIQAQMEHLHVPGVTVAVVKDGELFFAKGYGYADVEKGIAVDPETTAFRIGSVSKLFTWTAVMQLVEQGKLDLDADVNTYLDFEIPATYPEPIAMKHLMSHTPGFEVAYFEEWAPSAEQNVPLEEWLATHIPARVRQPGIVTGYSNYGAALAGYIVEVISGVPYEQYIQDNILAPLGMTHSTAYQPVSSELAPDLASAYVYAGDVYQAQAFEYINIGPAGAISASGTDIAKFMLAHLQDGSYGDAQILEPATARQMHSTLFTHDPRLNGMAHGFIEDSHNGQRMLWHAGSTLLFKTNLVLLPDQGVGFFISGNSPNADELRYEVVYAFIDRYYPAPDAPTSQPLSDGDLSRFVGSYLTTRRSYTKMGKGMYILGTVEVKVTQDGLLTCKDQQFMPIEPLLFQKVGGQEKLGFRQDREGNITHLFFDSKPICAFEKQEGVEATSFQNAVSIPSLTLFLLTLVIWPVGAFINRRKGITHPPLASAARWASVGMIVLNVIIAASILLALFPFVNGMLYGDVTLNAIMSTLASIAAVLALGTTVFVGLAWKQEYWTLVGRIHYTLVTLAGLGFAWWLNYWNLIGWKL
jgi:CubicO group peptidase (beta-lactamase class C family)